MEFKIQAEPRAVLKKKVKKIRKEGKVPAAIFGYKGNLNVQLPFKEFSKIFAEAGHTSIVDIDLEGNIHSVLVDEVQINPATRDMTHVSLREVRMDEEVTLEVPFELVGEDESPAVKDEDSLIILSVPAIEVRGLPRKIPSEIKIDVSGFHAGDTIILSQIKLPEGISLIEHEEKEEEEAEVTIVTTVAATMKEVEHVPTIAEMEAAAEAEKTEGGEASATAEDEKASNKE